MSTVMSISVPAMLHGSALLSLEYSLQRQVHEGGAELRASHRAAEFLAQIPKPMPRVASGLAGPKFGATPVWASSQSSSFPTAQKKSIAPKLMAGNLPESAEHDSQAVIGFPLWILKKTITCQ
jgi:hypothetical protein